ncbi:hypothetical protein VC83_00597 [Pseudogymnoascus destructans]|uniref:Uncharacterized protein n=2 Tax=Pseudogymnoascus destructans TaxID=655981 RepID=L8G8C3_PSED2|nr:uncharacterized protein VC83_00597 [Pseudogymnoascus destructans]ELR09485.1 hypothetical protein GMDG_00667 [Pseudogymnoascus destructans 20631-21]OAF63089.1 hypothetical protein VC83_00597 [Pseudogymnoascus destructans]
MDGFGASSSASKAVEDENEGPEYASNTGKPPSKQKGRRNIMLEKFRADVEPSLASYTHMQKPFFFYGFRLPEPPVLEPASVQGYKIMLWGQYPALVNGPIDNHVDGMSLAQRSWWRARGHWTSGRRRSRRKWHRTFGSGGLSRKEELWRIASNLVE